MDYLIGAAVALLARRVLHMAWDRWWRYRGDELADGLRRLSY